MRFIYLIAFLFPGLVCAQAVNDTIDPVDTSDIPEIYTPSYISVTAGGFRPGGDLASTLGADAGYARTGTGVSVQGAYLFTPHLGLGATFSYSRHPIDKEKYSYSLPTMSYGTQISIPDNTDVLCSSLNACAAFTAGSFVYDIDIAGGWMRMQEGLLTANNYGNGYTYKIRKYNLNGYLVNVGAGMRCNLSGRSFVHVKLGYSVSSVTGKRETEESENGVTVADVTSIERISSLLYLSVGFGYQFPTMYRRK
jgi:hypothetical protein